MTYDHVTYDHAAPLHEIEPEAPAAKLSNQHAVYTTESAATGTAPAPAPTSYFYDSRIQQQHQQQHHPQQQQQHHPQHSQQQQLQPLTNGFVAEQQQQPGFESQKLNELRQKYASPPQRPTTTAASPSTAATTSEDDAENEVALPVEAVTTSAPRVTVSVSKSVTTSVRRVTADGVTLITPLGGNGNGNTDGGGGGESGKLQVRYVGERSAD